MTHAARLLQLQDVDSELDGHRARLQAIERALQDSPAVREAHQHLVQAETRVQTTRAAMQAFEYDLQALNLKISEVEEQAYSGQVTNPRQLQDLQKDVESLKRRRSGLEEQQLEALIQTETAETHRSTAQEALHRAETETAKTQSALVAERVTRKGQVEQLEARREVIVTALASNHLQLYDSLRTSKKGRAVTRLADGVCTACGVEVSSALAQTVRQGQQVVQCANCGRILCAE